MCSHKRQALSRSWKRYDRHLGKLQVSIIVMLTGLEEGNKKKADQYWPDKDQETLDLGNGVNLKHVSTTFQGTYLNR